MIMAKILVLLLQSKDAKDDYSETTLYRYLYTELIAHA